MTPGNPIQILGSFQQATVGNVTLFKISTGGREHIYLQSSDPLTRGFRVTIRSTVNGCTIGIPIPFPCAVVHGSYKLEGVLEHITVEELQQVRNTAFVVKDGRIGE